MTVPLRDSETLNVSFYMVLNFTTSVVLIWINKLIFKSGFSFVITLTVVHFLTTFLGLWVFSLPQLGSCVDLSPKPNSTLTLKSVIPISLAFCGFVVFNNLSLQFNTVGTYQLMKVLTTPTIVVIQMIGYKETFPKMHLVSLVPVCVGVVLATVSSVETNLIGTACGVGGIIVTSFYQIWVKTEQDRLNCSSERLLYYQSPVSVCILVLIAPFADDIQNLFLFEWVTTATVFFIFLSCLLALLVNVSIFLVIKKTSPVSYNVLGHGKLCVILLMGYLVFGDDCNAKNIVGVSLAVFGIVWYTHLKLMGMNVPKAALEQDESRNCELGMKSAQAGAE